MDPNISESGSTRQASSGPSPTAYPQGGTSVTTPLSSSPDAFAPTTPHLDSQSRNNLRQASVALDTAYERITSLRNSINDMLNRIPPEARPASTGLSTSSTDTSTTQPRPSLTHEASIRPPHSALVLSSEQVVEELNLRAARLRSLISPSARQRLEDFETNGRSHPRRESTWERFSQSDRPRFERTDLRPPPSRHRPRTPPMPDLVLPRARDPADHRAAQRRELQSANQDDSSTMIGRRVAARVNVSDSHGNLSSRLSVSQIEQQLQAQTAQIARELESMTDRLAAQRSRRVELASSSVRGDSAAAAQVSQGSDLRSVPNPPAGGRPLRPSHNVTLVDNTTRIVLPQPISRTSSDGMPIVDLLGPAPPNRSLSAAFREQYTETFRASDVTLTSPRNLANSPEVRGTLVNLLVRDRDDQFQSTRQAELARPGVDTSVPIRSNPTSPPTGQSRRRRGWTRLNADGDEIDSDEDDSVSPHTRRLRMRFAYGTPNVDQSATRSHTVTIEDILWRTSGSDSEADALSPDSTESCPSLFQGSPPRPPVRLPHPLPTPVEHMLVYPTAKPLQESNVVCVSKYASLAGR